MTQLKPSPDISHPTRIKHDSVLVTCVQSALFKYTSPHFKRQVQLFPLWQYHPHTLPIRAHIFIRTDIGKFNNCRAVTIPIYTRQRYVNFTQRLRFSCACVLPFLRSPLSHLTTPLAHLHSWSVRRLSSCHATNVALLLGHEETWTPYLQRSKPQ